jgi:hypothetical protein
MVCLYHQYLVLNMWTAAALLLFMKYRHYDIVSPERLYHFRSHKFASLLGPFVIFFNILWKLSTTRLLKSTQIKHQWTTYEHSKRQIAQVGCQPQPQNIRPLYRNQFNVCCRNDEKGNRPNPSYRSERASDRKELTCDDSNKDQVRPAGYKYIQTQLQVQGWIYRKRWLSD